MSTTHRKIEHSASIKGYPDSIFIGEFIECFHSPIVQKTKN
jgi:hypothetical protein